VPVQIVPSTSEQVTPDCGPGNAQLAGSRAATMLANTNTPHKISQIVRFGLVP
jgi:hypothetical protein